MVKVAVDYENNSELFWTSFHDAFPQYRGMDTFYLTTEQWEQVQQLPGWDDDEAPKYAPHPLLELDDDDLLVDED